MHLNERLEKSREAIGQQLAVGQQKVSSAYNRLWAEMEAMREAQKKRQEEQRLAAEREGRPFEQNSGKCKSLTLLREEGIGKMGTNMMSREIPDSGFVACTSKLTSGIDARRRVLFELG